MKIRNRFLLGLLIVTAVSLLLLVKLVTEDLKPRYRESTEDPLVDTAYLLAAIAAEYFTPDNTFDSSSFAAAFRTVAIYPPDAHIYNFHKTAVDFRVYVTNQKGIVIFDSEDRDIGQDYSMWRDVHLSLEGVYGARSTKEGPEDAARSTLYIGAPIRVNGEIKGVLTVGKNAQNVNYFVATAKRSIIFSSILIFACFSLVAFLLAVWITRPIKLLTDYAKKVSQNQHIELPCLTPYELKELGNAFEEMRQTLEGRNYVENYVQTLTHEIKSPLAAIKGAAELLEDHDMPSEIRSKFLANINQETERIKEFVEKLLFLASLEKKQRLELAPISLNDLLNQAVASTEIIALAKDITVTLDIESDLELMGDDFLLRQAIINLLKNAIEFSPAGSSITASVGGDDKNITIAITDEGPGIPDYAQDKIFNRFYSLPRPNEQFKSSGLGLTIVSEIASMHKGSISFNSNPHKKGSTFTLRLQRGKRP